MLRRTFEVVKIVVGVGNRGARNDHAVVPKERDVPPLHCMGDALAFSDIERQPVVPGIDHDAPMESQGILAQQGIDGAGFSQRERCGVGHVRVQHNNMTSDPMDRCVNEQCGRFRPMPTLEDLAIAVHEQYVIGTDLAPVQAAWVEQEPVSIHCHAEVVADAFR